VAAGEIPIDVQLLLQEAIRSVEQLEILLALRDKSDHAWTSKEVYQVIRSSERSVERTLEELTARGFLVRSEGPERGYRYAPRTAELADTISRLSHLYSERRVRIIEAIYAERVSEVDEFAKAFRLRKDPNG